MLSLFSIPLLALAALAAPAAEVAEVEARQLLCPDIQVYFARGTTEVPTLGVVVGPPFASALKIAAIGKRVEFDGVPYPALVSGYLAGGDQGGGRTMADSVTSIANRCPNTKIVISGYRYDPLNYLQRRDLN